MKLNRVLTILKPTVKSKYALLLLVVVAPIVILTNFIQSQSSYNKEKERADLLAQYIETRSLINGETTESIFLEAGKPVYVRGGIKLTIHGGQFSQIKDTLGAFALDIELDGEDMPNYNYDSTSKSIKNVDSKTVESAKYDRMKSIMENLDRDFRLRPTLDIAGEIDGILVATYSGDDDVKPNIFEVWRDTQKAFTDKIRREKRIDDYPSAKIRGWITFFVEGDKFCRPSRVDEGYYLCDDKRKIDRSIASELVVEYRSFSQGLGFYFYTTE